MSFNHEQIKANVEKMVQIRDYIHTGNKNNKEQNENLKPIKTIAVLDNTKKE